MKRYTITVNGTAYDVTVDEANGAAPAALPFRQRRPAPAPAAGSCTCSAPAPEAKPAATGSEGAVKVDAPMPGTILDVKVSVGASVNSGEVICILEAMKMENEIVAPQAGTVSSVNVSKGDSVEAGQVIVTMN